MAVTTNANSTPGEIQKGDDVPSNPDAARPVIDRIKDIDMARDGGATSGADTVIDNTPETAALNEAAEKEAADAEKAEKAAAKKADKGSK